MRDGAPRRAFVRVGAVAGALLLASACSADDPRRAPPPSAGIDESFLDRKADPCKDFFQFACGTWVRQHPPDPGYVDARFVNGDQRNDIYFDGLLSNELDASISLTSARAFRSACMATRGGTQGNLAPANRLFTSIANASSKAQIAALLADLHAAHVSALFAARPRIDPKNPARHILFLGDDGWSLPRKDSYTEGVLEDPYLAHIAALSKPYSAPDLDPAVVWKVESRIATASAGESALRDPIATYNPIDAPGLSGRVTNFDWTTYFARRGFGAPEDLNLVEPAFFDALEALLADTSLDELHQYLAWRVMEATAEAGSSTTIREEEHFHGEVVDGRTSPEPDWYACLKATRALFGATLARAFTERFVADGTLNAASTLVDRVRRALRSDLQGVAWLDEATRQSALSKLDAVDAKVGFPENWFGFPEPSIDPGSTFLEAVTSAARFSSQGDADLLAQPVDRKVWAATPDTTNAFYSDERNDITIPVAILEDPFFRVDWSSWSNYGVLGAVVGHEMTHGFDNHGRLYDGAGTLSDWWTDSVDAEFTSRAMCLVDQFDGYEPIPGQHVDGAATLGENIADLGGLKLAHAAFAKATDDHGPPGGFDREQAFFVSYAQIWCTAESPEALAQSLPLDPHAPAKYRVNGVVRNLPEFAEAFHCKSGAELAPKDRCEVW